MASTEGSRGDCRTRTVRLEECERIVRPCGFATIEVNQRGRRKRIYRHKDYQTPNEKFTSLENWKKYLKRGVTAQFLNQEAQRRSDTQTARRIRKAKLTLLAGSRTTGRGGAKRCRLRSHSADRDLFLSQNKPKAPLASRGRSGREREPKKRGDLRQAPPASRAAPAFRLTPHWNST
jgi:hypothetical protein